jgi:hypothetical protein
MGNSAYNSLQLTLRHSSGGLTLLGSYTYGKSLDQASNLGEQVYPYDYRLTRVPFSFDIRQNFVTSYRYDLPFPKLFRRANEATKGWAISGITRGEPDLLRLPPPHIHDFPRWIKSEKQLQVAAYWKVLREVRRLIQLDSGKTAFLEDIPGAKLVKQRTLHNEPVMRITDENGPHRSVLTPGRGSRGAPIQFRCGKEASTEGRRGRSK